MKKNLSEEYLRRIFQKNLSKTKLTKEHLLKHIDEAQFDCVVLEKMYAHMAMLYRQLNKCYDIVDRNAPQLQGIWHRQVEAGEADTATKSATSEI